MSTNVQEIVQTLIEDTMIDFQRYQSPAASGILEAEKNLILSFVGDDKRPMLSRFLGFMVLAVELTLDIEDPTNRNCTDEFFQRLENKGSGSRGDLILASLTEEKFANDFLALFSTKFNSNKDQPHCLFPTLLNPKKMEKLEYLIGYCNGYSENLQQGAADQPEEKACCSPVSMMVLGGFIAALGVAAVAVGIALVMAGGFGTPLLVAGAAALVAGAIIVGIGFFRQKQLSADADQQLKGIHSEMAPFIREPRKLPVNQRTSSDDEGYDSDDHETRDSRSSLSS